MFSTLGRSKIQICQVLGMVVQSLRHRLQLLAIARSQQASRLFQQFVRRKIVRFNKDTPSEITENKGKVMLLWISRPISLEDFGEHFVDRDVSFTVEMSRRHVELAVRKYGAISGIKSAQSASADGPELAGFPYSVGGSLGRTRVNVVPSCSQLVKLTLPWRYRSPNNFMLCVPMPRPGSPLVVNDR